MDKDPVYFGSKYVEFCASWDDSRRLNHLPGPMVIIASSGMCEAGRIRHHLRHVVEDPDNAIVIVSYQAEGTLGRQIAEGVERIQIMDQWYDLNAAVYVLDGFSGPRRPQRPGLVVRADRRPDRARLPRPRRAREHGRPGPGPPAAREQPRPDPRAAGQLRGLSGAVIGPRSTSQSLEAGVWPRVGRPEPWHPAAVTPIDTSARRRCGGVGAASTLVQTVTRGGLGLDGFEAGGELGDHPADLRDHLGPRAALGPGQPAHQGAADDQAVGDGGEGADVLGEADPEADADRQLGLGPEPGDVLGQVGGRVVRSPVIPATET